GGVTSTARTFESTGRPAARACPKRRSSGATPVVNLFYDVEIGLLRRIRDSSDWSHFPGLVHPLHRLEKPVVSKTGRGRLTVPRPRLRHLFLLLLSQPRSKRQ